MKSKISQSQFFIPLCVFIFFCGFYMMTARIPITVSDGMINYLTTRAIVEESGLALDCGLDAAYINVGRKGDCFSKYDLGLSITAVPFYVVGRLFGGPVLSNDPTLITLPRILVSILNHITTALSAAILFILGLHISGSKQRAVELAFIFGIATIAWPYATTFFSQPLVGFLLLLAVTILIIQPELKKSHLLIAGILLGWACLVRFDTTPLIGPVLLYVIYRLRKQLSWEQTIKYTAVMLIPLAIFLFISLFTNWWRFGSPFQSGYEDEGWTNPFLSGLYGLIISPNKGVLFYSPLIIFSVFGLLKLNRENFKAESFLIFALLGTQLLIYSSWWAWEGGWSWGPRFLVSTLPLMMVGLIPWLNSNSKAVRLLFFVTLTISFFIQLIGVTTESMIYVVESGIDYEKILTVPLYSPIIGQFLDLLNKKTSLLITNYADSFLSQGQMIGWVLISLIFIILGAVGIKISLNHSSPSVVSKINLE